MYIKLINGIFLVELGILTVTYNLLTSFIYLRRSSMYLYIKVLSANEITNDALT
jgi:hypothetical protein